MSPQQDLVARYYAAFNARDFDAYARLCSPDIELVAPGCVAQGVEAMRSFDRLWTQAFPEAQIEQLRSEAAGRCVIACIWFHGGAQRGPVGSPVGLLAPTGKVVECPGYALFTLDGERIARQQLAFEPKWLALQLGLVQ